MSHDYTRNVVFCGEIGSGKSSAINLLLQTGPLAAVSIDSQPCTQAIASYQTTLNGARYNLWDTRGLGVRNISEVFLGRSPEQELKKFLGERQLRNELDLLVYCVRGSRAIAASAKHYNAICASTRRLGTPVVIVVTHLERMEHLENWWNRNSSIFKQLGMEFDGHVCITALIGHPRTPECQKRLVDLITGNYRPRPSSRNSNHHTAGSLDSIPLVVEPPSIPASPIRSSSHHQSSQHTSEDRMGSPTHHVRCVAMSHFRFPDLENI